MLFKMLMLVFVLAVCEYLLRASGHLRSELLHTHTCLHVGGGVANGIPWCLQLHPYIHWRGKERCTTFRSLLHASLLLAAAGPPSTPAVGPAQGSIPGAGAGAVSPRWHALQLIMRCEFSRYEEEEAMFSAADAFGKALGEQVWCMLVYPFLLLGTHAT